MAAPRVSERVCCFCTSNAWMANVCYYTYLERQDVFGGVGWSCGQEFCNLHCSYCPRKSLVWQTTVQLVVYSRPSDVIC